MLICFRKAYIDERTGLEVTNGKLIAKHYLKFYFWVDIISAIPFSMLTSEMNVLKYISLVKIFRLFRLGKITTFMKFDTKTRARIRVIYMIITLFIVIHFVTCYFYLVTQIQVELIHQVHDSDNPWFIGQQDFKTWNNDFWIPPVDVPDRESNYYHYEPMLKYLILLYYSILLVLGNDIIPQTSSELAFCTLIIYLGAFFEAYIMGSMAAELHKSDD